MGHTPARSLQQIMLVHSRLENARKHFLGPATLLVLIVFQETAKR